MSRVEAIVGSMLGLILVYLLVKNSVEVGTIFKSLAGATIGVFGTLQGRPVNAFGVSLGG
jgi:allophanate hydrolase subunit 2